MTYVNCQFIKQYNIIILLCYILTDCYKTLIYPISALKNKFDPRNTAGMPVVKFIFRLELEEIFIL